MAPTLRSANCVSPPAEPDTTLETVPRSPPVYNLDDIKEIIAKSGNPHDIDVDIGYNMVVKRGSYISRSEVSAMQLVREGTLIPVPRVISYFSEPRNDEYGPSHKGYLVMEKIPGVPLFCLLRRLDFWEKKKIANKLRKIVKELRKLDDPIRWGMVGKDGAYHGGYFYLSNGDGSSTCQPCSPHAVSDVVNYFVKSLLHARLYEKYEAGGSRYKNIAPALVEHNSVFSHGDLGPENIMVDPSSLKITGILDWGLAGWYPRYWNHMMARSRRYSYSHEDFQCWKDIYTQVFKLYPAAVNGFEILHDSVDIYANTDGPGWCTCCRE